MQKSKYISILLVVVLVCGCSKVSEQEKNQEEVEILSENSTEKDFLEEFVAPSKEEIYSKRREALIGLKEKEIDEFTEYIKNANLAFEHAKLYSNFFENLSDPNYPAWNYFMDTGYIQVGWAFDEDCKYNESLGITYEEFLDKYGSPVMHHNDYNGKDFINTIESIKDSLESDLLYEDLENLINNMTLAMETHEVKYIEKLYYILHDMDYYFFRYAPEDVVPYVTDASTVTQYYDYLEIYK